MGSDEVILRMKQVIDYESKCVVDNNRYVALDQSLEKNGHIQQEKYRFMRWVTFPQS